MIFIGVDAGAKGGIAVLNGDDAFAIPFDQDYLVATCEAHKNEEVLCVLEAVHAMPNQGVVSMFNFGANYGFIKGVFHANRFTYLNPSPQVWKKVFGLHSDKQESIDLCKKLFPKVNLFRTPKCKKEHDGMAEALLLAEYGRRAYNEGFLR